MANTADCRRNAQAEIVRNMVVLTRMIPISSRLLPNDPMFWEALTIPSARYCWSFGLSTLKMSGKDDLARLEQIRLLSEIVFHARALGFGVYYWQQYSH